jgi:putative transposase
MPRPRRMALGGLVYHVLNRANARRRIFEAPGDYAAFERILSDVQLRTGMRMLAWCLMPNHWHLVLWPREDGELSLFVRLVTLTHVQRWHAYRGTAGMGHLYQGRFKSFVVKADEHLLAVCRYVEANALRGGLVERAEDWRWSSLGRHAGSGPEIEPWPVPKPSHWVAYVNERCSREELDRLRTSALRPRGRPRKKGS